MRSSTNLIKSNNSSQSILSWSPEELQQQIVAEAQTFEMFSGDDTEKDERSNAAHRKYQPSHTTWDVPEFDHAYSDAQKDQTPLPPVKTEPTADLLQTLFSNKPPPPKKVLFKSDQIIADSINWPTIEDLLPPQEEEPFVVETPQEEAPPLPDMDEVKLQIEQMILEAQEQAQQEAQKIAQEIASQAQMDAEKILQQARDEASTLLLKANQQESEIAQRSYRKGMDAAKEEALSVLSTAHAILSGTREWHKKMLAQAETEVVGVLKEVAKNLFGQGMVLPDDVLKEVFNRAIAEAKSLGDLRIRIHPEDIAILGESWAEQKSTSSGIKIKLLPSEDIQRGGCVIEGDFGILDARVDLKMSHILEKIEEIQKLPFELEGEDESPVRSEEAFISQETDFVKSNGTVEDDTIGLAEAFKEDDFFPDTQFAVSEEEVVPSGVDGMIEEPEEKERS